MNEASGLSVTEVPNPSRLRRRACLRTAKIALGCAAAWLGLAPWALGACKIKVVGELHVDTTHNRVITQGQIDGKPIRIAIDTGAGSSWLWADSAKRLGLHTSYEGRVKFYGVGGEVQPSQTLINHLQIGTIYGNKMPMIVLPANPNRPSNGPDFVMGNDMLASFDTEFDLAHGMIRLLEPDGCTVDELPYWTDRYSQADLENGDDVRRARALIKTRVLVNGKPVEAELDTGSSFTSITRDAAQTAGVTPWLTNPPPAGMVYGIGPQPVPSWVASFDSFSIGDETIRHVPMRIADLFGADKSVHLGSRIAKSVDDFPTMLIGCDFFLAHHLLVLNRQRKLLFTYNGGTVFQTPTGGQTSKSTPASGPPSDRQP